jgi:hypothetical protein
MSLLLRPVRTIRKPVHGADVRILLRELASPYLYLVHDGYIRTLVREPPIRRPGPRSCFRNSGVMFGLIECRMAKNPLWLIGACWLLVSVGFAWNELFRIGVSADTYYFGVLFCSVQALWFFYWVRAFRNRSNVRRDHSAGYV